MNQLDHCKLCDFHDVNLQKGVFCSLTGEKPQFQHRCDDAEMYEVAQMKLEESSGRVYLLQAQKTDRKIMVFGQIILGTLIAAGGLYLNKMYWDGGWIAYPLLVLPFMGFGLISAGIRFQVKSSWEIKNSQELLERDLFVLRQYGLSPSATHDVRKVHDEWEIKSNVTLR